MFNVWGSERMGNDDKKKRATTKIELRALVWLGLYIIVGAVNFWIMSMDFVLRSLIP